jgi:mRNA-degrading endonuclease RelE of RelBE toxin-antitoxin system
MLHFVEANAFTRRVYDYLDEQEYILVQEMLTVRPDVGAVVPHSGGIRKLRWRGSGRGKRGGLRIIYYWDTPDRTILLLTIYAKNEMVDIPAPTLRLLREEVERVKRKR